MIFRYQILYVYKLHFPLSVSSFQKHFNTPLLHCFLHLYDTILRMFWKVFCYIMCRIKWLRYMENCSFLKSLGVRPWTDLKIRLKY